MSEYLREARASGLAAALLGDERLAQMAQTPLTLSMMTLAYGGSTPVDIPSYSSLTEQRHHLMERYVERMLQREERRIHRKIIYDEDPKKEVSVKQYAYPPERLKKYLGWLAVRLSVRSQTAFSTHGLFNLLSRDLDRDHQSGVWWILMFCRAVLLFLLLLLTSTVVAPMTTDAWFRVIEISLFGTVSYVLVAWASSSDFEMSDVLGSILGVSLLLGGVAAVAAVLGLGALALPSILPFNIPLQPIVIIVACLCASIVVVMDRGPLRKPRSSGVMKSVFLSILVMTVTFLTSVTAMRVTGRGDEWHIPAVALAVVLAVQIVISFRGEGWKMLYYLSFCATLFLMPITSAGLIGDLTWYLPMTLFSMAAALVLGSLGEPLLCLAGIFLCFVLGSLVGGVAGAVISSITYGYLLLLWVIYDKKDEPENDAVLRLHSFVHSVSARCEQLGDRYFLSPILLRIMVITRRLPWRFMRFFRYAERALLLKRSASDFEFVHRLLRDYFALRDLQPLLREQHSGKRIQSIRSLGFQGDAATDALAEFMRSPDADTREAAAEALGRIASPEVVQHVEATVQDPEPKVRRAAVLSTKNFTMQDRVRCLLLVMEDRDLSVQRALLEVALGASPHLLVGGWEPFDLYVFEHVRNRDDLKHIVFQIVETQSENRLRASAINFVSELKDFRAVPALVTAMLDRKFPYYFMAAIALAKIKDPSAVKHLIAFAGQRDKERRMVAVRALQQFDTPEAIEAAEKFSRRL